MSYFPSAVIASVNDFIAWWTSSRTAHENQENGNEDRNHEAENNQNHNKGFCITFLLFFDHSVPPVATTFAGHLDRVSWHRFDIVLLSWLLLRGLRIVHVYMDYGLLVIWILWESLRLRKAIVADVARRHLVFVLIIGMLRLKVLVLILVLRVKLWLSLLRLSLMRLRIKIVAGP